MTEGEHVGADAPGLAALPADDPARAAAYAHAAACPGCARALREAERLEALLAEVDPGAVPPGPLGAAVQAIEDELVRERRRRGRWAALAAAAVAVALVASSGHRGGSALDWALAGALGVAGAALAALAARVPWGALGGGLAAAAAVLLAGHGGPLQAATGAHCLLTELVCGAAVAWAGWLALRGGTTRAARSSMAAAAAAGAVAGAGALQVTCGAHGAGLHLLAFHAGGVALAAGAAALVWRPRRATA